MSTAMVHGWQMTCSLLDLGRLMRTVSWTPDTSGTWLPVRRMTWHVGPSTMPHTGTPWVAVLLTVSIFYDIGPSYELEAKDVLANINRTQAAERAKNAVFFPGDLDIDLQTCSGEVPNMSSVWIWRKSVQLFQSCFIHKQKTQTHVTKNRTFRSSVRAVTASRFHLKKFLISS